MASSESEWVLISGIPRAAVHNTLSLHDSPKSPLSSPHADSPTAFVQGSPSLYPAGARKSSNGSSASTKVIDSLQTELLNTKVHLERVKSNLRGSQRVIASVSPRTVQLFSYMLIIAWPRDRGSKGNSRKAEEGSRDGSEPHSEEGKDASGWVVSVRDQPHITNNQRCLSGPKKQKVKQHPSAVINVNWSNRPRNP